MAKILVVEDDNALREINQAALEAAGFTVVTAVDGESGLTMAVNEKPDLILSDVMMPKISGFEMLDIIRATPEIKDTKVIMLTALSDAEQQTKAEKLGADRYMVKSQLTMEDIIKAINELLGLKSVEAEQAKIQDIVDDGLQKAQAIATPKKIEEKPVTTPVQVPAANAIPTLLTEDQPAQEVETPTTIVSEYEQQTPEESPTTEQQSEAAKTGESLEPDSSPTLLSDVEQTVTDTDQPVERTNPKETISTQPEDPASTITEQGNTTISEAQDTEQVIEIKHEETTPTPEPQIVSPPSESVPETAADFQAKTDEIESQKPEGTTTPKSEETVDNQKIDLINNFLKYRPK